ncbi:MAG: glycoside hydrolase family 10 protein [Spirulinaceae cyanobacterium]
MRIKPEGWIVILFILGLVITIVTRPPEILAPQRELRGVWLTNIDSEVLFSARKLRQSLKRLARLNFNTVYPTVWTRGHTLYPSKVAESVLGISLDPEPGLQKRDILEEIVEQGHREGLTVIPWFEFGFVVPSDSPIIQLHPDWLTNRQDGGQTVYRKGQEIVWLNPFHPQVQQFMTVIFAEIVANYDIDGIQFDDNFGVPVDMGYDPYTLALYRSQHQGNSPPANFRDPEWMRWRSNQLTELVTQLFHTIKALKPKCLIGLSPNSQHYSYNNYLQDWQTWQERGLIDELILQVYWDDLERFRAELQLPEVKAASQKIPVGIGILTGLKKRFVPMSQVQAQVKIVRQEDLAGVAFFFYETLAGRDRQLKELFANPATRPGASD